MLFRKLITQPPNAVLEFLHVEMDQQADVAAGQLEVGEQPGFVNGLKLRHSLALQDDQVFAEQVDAIAAVDWHISIDAGQGLLAHNAKSPPVSSNSGQAS